jgi:hypothetical protein
MKKNLLLIILLIFTLSLQAQKDSTKYLTVFAQQDVSRTFSQVNITIYPVPVRENSFTIRSDKDISLVKITNIIGQDIMRLKYSDPQQLIRVTLDNPKRGMYLVTINFFDGTRVVKKILVEESD